MTHRAVCELSDRIRAAFSVVAGFPIKNLPDADNGPNPLLNNACYKNVPENPHDMTWDQSRCSYDQWLDFEDTYSCDMKKEVPFMSTVGA